MKKYFKIIGLVLLSLSMLLGLFIYLFAPFFNQRLKHQYQIMSFRDWQKTEMEYPYQFILSKPEQVLFYFGANHSHDYANQQYPKLEKFWQEFLQQTKGKNCIVLVEALLNSEKRRSIKTKQQACIPNSESSFITFVADQARIQVVCPEPDEKTMIDTLLEQFPQDLVAYHNFAQVVVQYNDVKAIDPATIFEVYMAPFVASDQKIFSIDVSLKAMAKIHEKLFNQPFNPDDKEFFVDQVYKNQDSVIFQVEQEAAVLRDQGIVAYIHQLIKQGENIFVVYGGAHAVMQEQAIRSIF